MEGKSRRAFQDLSDEEIQGLVESLNSLHEGELGVAMLVACGERAIPPLRKFLVHGKPSGVFIPRQRAVHALAELGAKHVLLEYLDFEKDIADPVAAYGEEGVRNTAARALAAWHTDDIYEGLLKVLRKRRLPGLIETLGEFERSEAIPDLVARPKKPLARLGRPRIPLSWRRHGRPILLAPARARRVAAGGDVLCGFCDDYDCHPMTGRNWPRFSTTLMARLPRERARSRWPLPMNRRRGSRSVA